MDKLLLAKHQAEQHGLEVVTRTDYDKKGHINKPVYIVYRKHIRMGKSASLSGLLRLIQKVLAGRAAPVRF